MYVCESKICLRVRIGSVCMYVEVCLDISAVVIMPVVYMY